MIKYYYLLNNLKIMGTSNKIMVVMLVESILMCNFSRKYQQTFYIWGIIQVCVLSCHYGFYVNITFTIHSPLASMFGAMRHQLPRATLALTRAEAIEIENPR